MIKDGAIGETRIVSASFSFEIEDGDWRLDPARGGGALWDVGCYGVNAARLFFAEELEPLCVLAKRGPTGVDLSLTTLLHSKERPFILDFEPSETDLSLFKPKPDLSSLVAYIECSFEKPFTCSLAITGDSGSLDLPLAFLPPDDPEILHHYYRGLVDRIPIPKANQYSEMVDTFVLSIVSGEGKLLFPAEDGLAQMKLLDAIQNSANWS